MKGKRIKIILYYSTTFMIFISTLYLIINYSLNRYYLRQYNEVNENSILVEKSMDNDKKQVVREFNDTQVEVSKENPKIETPKTLNDYQKLYNNTDIVGRLNIKNTNISFLLVQTTDNSYYLNHLINKEPNKLGATFIDYRVDLETTKKINIYGHNNGPNSNSFNKLINYLDQNYYENHKLIQLEIDNSIDTYEIFSIEIVKDNRHMQMSFTNVEWYIYRRDIINNSIYSTNTKIDDIEKLITLQTCMNNKNDELLLIHGRKIHQ